MVSPQVTKKWLEKADRDFGYASKSLLDPKLGYFDLIAFHFQQAGEKYLKAYIVANELEFQKLHNLIELIEICKRKNARFETLRGECQFLTGFYIEPRYPEMITATYTRQLAKKAQKSAKKIGDFVKKLL